MPSAHTTGPTTSSFGVLATNGFSLTLLLCLLCSPLWAIPNSASDVDPELREALKAAVNSNHSFDDRYDAEAWLMAMSSPLTRFVKTPEERVELLRKVHQEASRADVPADLVLAVIEIESHFKQYAISRVGAQGMMQVMPFWRKEIGRPDDNLTDIETNLRYGCAILKHYLNKEKGRIAPALARYNGSYGRTIYSDKVIRVWRRHWFGGYTQKI